MATGLKLIAGATVCASLSGCWFVYIPGELIAKTSDAVTGDSGEHCVGKDARLGDSIRIRGKGNGTVVGLSGTSSRCPQKSHPIRADLVFTE